MSEGLFYLLALCLLGSSLSVAFSSYPVRSILSLISCFVITAILWLLMGAEFLALSLIFVYVGAVMALFLFIVFMLNVDRLPGHFSNIQKLLYFFVALGIVITFVLKGSSWFDWQLLPQDVKGSNTQSIGVMLYTDYWFAFESIGFILLSAMIGAVALVTKDNKVAKYQVIKDQLATLPRERLKKVDL